MSFKESSLKISYYNVNINLYLVIDLNHWNYQFIYKSILRHFCIFQIFFFFFFFVFLGQHPQHLEVSRLGVQSELQPLAYTRVTAKPRSGRVCDLHYSSWQHWILTPLIEARDRTYVLMDASQVSLTTEPPWELLYFWDL